MEQYGQPNHPWARDNYFRSFDEGLADPNIIKTLAGCNNAINTNMAKLR